MSSSSCSTRSASSPTLSSPRSIASAASCKETVVLDNRGAIMDQKNVVYPRPQKSVPVCLTRCIAVPKKLEEACQPTKYRSRLTSSLRSLTSAEESSGESELRQILQKSSSPRAVTTYGVSPPSRGGNTGGASNPLCHDKKWKCGAYMASHQNLETLRELDAVGVSFLHSSGAGDVRVLLGSPEFGTLSEADSWGGHAEAQVAEEREPFSCRAEYFTVRG